MDCFFKIFEFLNSAIRSIFQTILWPWRTKFFVLLISIEISWKMMISKITMTWILAAFYLLSILRYLCPAWTSPKNPWVHHMSQLSSWTVKRDPGAVLHHLWPVPEIQVKICMDLFEFPIKRPVSFAIFLRALRKSREYRDLGNHPRLRSHTWQRLAATRRWYGLYDGIVFVLFFFRFASFNCK